MVGIIIGVGAVIILTSLVGGLEKQIKTADGCPGKNATVGAVDFFGLN